MSRFCWLQVLSKLDSKIFSLLFNPLLPISLTNKYIWRKWICLRPSTLFLKINDKVRCKQEIADSIFCYLFVIFCYWPYSKSWRGNFHCVQSLSSYHQFLHEWCTYCLSHSNLISANMWEHHLLHLKKENIIPFLLSGVGGQPEDIVDTDYIHQHI